MFSAKANNDNADAKIKEISSKFRAPCPQRSFCLNSIYPKLKMKKICKMTKPTLQVFSWDYLLHPRHLLYFSYLGVDRAPLP